MKYLTIDQVQSIYNISKMALSRLEKKGLQTETINQTKMYKESVIEKCLDDINNGIKSLKIGSIYNNTSISNIFMCSTQGGMRRSHITNTLIIFSDHTKGIYDDRWIDESTILYTGMGQEGDQTLDGNQNKTLYESKDSGITIHLFETFNTTEHMYRGKVKLIDNPFTEYQEDAKGIDRKVWVFKLKLEVNTPIPFNLIEKVNEKKKNQANKMSFDELKKVAKNSSKVSIRSSTSKTYIRNIFVSQYVKKRANGVCDLCGSEAPFKDKNGDPYLESHHVEWLSNGGEDSVDNCVALCPSCHRKIHILNLKEDNDSLKNRLNEYQSINI